MLFIPEEYFKLIAWTSIFFILLISVIIITAVLYHNRKRAHKMAVAEFDNALIRSRYEVQEQTMQTIGADLHDNIGQLLSLISLTLSSVDCADAEKAREKVDGAYTLTIRSIKEMRALGKLLQGEQLIREGLAQAIRHEISWLERSEKYLIRFTESGQAPAAMNTDTELIVFRILQETLNNTIKHAYATFIRIDLSYTGDALIMTVEDNGVGFDPAAFSTAPTGMGLLNIRKRAAVIGGELVLGAAIGKGTTIKLTIPYP